VASTAQRGFDVIHACNPPDTIFLIGGFSSCSARSSFSTITTSIRTVRGEVWTSRFFLQLLVAFERGRSGRRTYPCHERVIPRECDRAWARDRTSICRGQRSRPGRLKILPPVAETQKGPSLSRGYVGVMGKQEGLTTATAAQHIVRDLKPDRCSLRVGGWRTELEDMKTYAQSLGLGDYVTLPGAYLISRCSKC